MHDGYLKKFGLNPVVAINHFITDTDKEINLVKDHCLKLNVNASVCTHWSDGGAGTETLALLEEGIDVATVPWVNKSEN